MDRRKESGRSSIDAYPIAPQRRGRAMFRDTGPPAAHRHAREPLRRAIGVHRSRTATCARTQVADRETKALVLSGTGRLQSTASGSRVTLRPVDDPALRGRHTYVQSGRLIGALDESGRSFPRDIRLPGSRFIQQTAAGIRHAEWRCVSNSGPKDVRMKIYWRLQVPRFLDF